MSKSALALAVMREMASAIAADLTEVQCLRTLAAAIIAGNY